MFISIPILVTLASLAASGAAAAIPRANQYSDTDKTGAGSTNSFDLNVSSSASEQLAGGPQALDPVDGNPKRLSASWTGKRLIGTALGRNLNPLACEIDDRGNAEDGGENNGDIDEEGLFLSPLCASLLQSLNRERIE
ncbi:hypothetical protein GYMLUDRAFT_252020 [Collybiopsis luxurians FD-317 M1]|uniref:Uncharacterized protein n=1 Tax=Collybiopsis luxurians FD-317 M1 TaxID=944289 RepID=A0A0D0C1D1_9AGAR|nr:hypothetical protein GYMLUDRAFT_252020 [Collybiopsis luxurians FD-317 M1]